MADMNYRAVYTQWLHDFANDDALVAELSALTDEKQIEDRFYTELAFGTAGMRGVLGYGTNRMNVYVVRRATRGLAAYIHTFPGGAERGVAIAYDSRHMSAEFARETALTLCALARLAASIMMSSSMRLSLTSKPLVRGGSQGVSV